MSTRFLRNLCGAGFLSMAGCKPEVIDEPANSTDTGDTGQDLKPGKFWVKSAAGATGYIGEQQYYILDESGGPVVDGVCVCIPLHIVYLSFLDGLLWPEPPEEALAVNQAIHNGALYACLQRAHELGLDLDSTSCNSTLSTATPHVLGDCEDEFLPGPPGSLNNDCEGLPGTDETDGGAMPAGADIEFERRFEALAE